MKTLQNDQEKKPRNQKKQGQINFLIIKKNKNHKLEFKDKIESIKILKKKKENEQNKNRRVE